MVVDYKNKILDLVRSESFTVELCKALIKGIRSVLPYAEGEYKDRTRETLDNEALSSKQKVLKFIEENNFPKVCLEVIFKMLNEGDDCGFPNFWEIPIFVESGFVRPEHFGLGFG